MPCKLLGKAYMHESAISCNALHVLCSDMQVTSGTLFDISASSSTDDQPSSPTAIDIGVLEAYTYFSYPDPDQCTLQLT